MHGAVSRHQGLRGLVLRQDWGHSGERAVENGAEKVLAAPMCYMGYTNQPYCTYNRQLPSKNVEGNGGTTTVATHSWDKSCLLSA